MEKQIKVIYGITKGKKGNFWTRIGVGFSNKDGSLNLVFNYLPTDPAVTVQVRDAFEGDEQGTRAEASS